MVVMRAFISVFSLILFLSSQAIAHACPSDCSHHQKQEVLHTSNHDCCEGTACSENEEKSHDCELGHCFKSAELEFSTLTAENRFSKKDFDSSIAVADHRQVIAGLANKNNLGDYRDRWHHSPKVPLYIAYQKLLLP